MAEPPLVERPVACFTAPGNLTKLQERLRLDFREASGVPVPEGAPE